MENFNRNNPTEGWTEDEKYDFCKMENKWVKELPKNICAKIKIGVAHAANEPTFTSVEEINIAFGNDILQRKENWKHLCHICDHATNQKSKLTKHLASHGIGERYKCDKCEKDFSHKCNLTIHQKSHTSTSINKCNQCDKFYKTKNGLKEHIQRMHSEKHLKCDECEKMFSNVRSLNHHKKVVHVLRSFKCDQCKFRSKTKFDLQTHIKGVHDGVQVQKTLNATYVIFKEQNKI